MVRGFLSDSAQLEAERNVEKKLGRAAIARLAWIVAAGDLHLIATPKFLPSAYAYINDKDKHIYAAAVSIRAAYIITHDRALIREINQQGDIMAMTPGDFLQQVAPHLARR